MAMSYPDNRHSWAYENLFCAYILYLVSGTATSLINIFDPPHDAGKGVQVIVLSTIEGCAAHPSSHPVIATFLCEAIPLNHHLHSSASICGLIRNQQSAAHSLTERETVDIFEFLRA
jgi:hypothetical protein